MKVTFDVLVKKQLCMSDLDAGDVFTIKGGDLRVPFMMLKPYSGGCSVPDFIEHALRRAENEKLYVYTGFRVGTVFTSEKNLFVNRWHGELRLTEEKE